MKNVLLLVLLLLQWNCFAQPKARPKVRYQYQLNLKELQEGKLNVTLHLNQSFNQDSILYYFPKIVPGIYGAMDFGQYIEQIQFKDKQGKELICKKNDINSWRVYGAKKLSTVTYQVREVYDQFGAEKDGFYRSAASTFHKDVFILNNNCLFGYFENHLKDAFLIQIEKPQTLAAFTSLSQLKKSKYQDIFYSNNYNHLVDCPILYCKPDYTLIKLPNIEVTVACYSSSQKPISKEVANYIKPLLINQSKYLNGKMPVKKYSFLIYHNLISDTLSYGYDGLEHSNSTLILSQCALNMEVIKTNVYSVASHEFFHILMPLGIHSKEIGDYNFNNPKFSQHLWLYEGMTEYFTIHMPIKNHVESLDKFMNVLEKKYADMLKFDNTLPFTELSSDAMNKQDQYYNVYLKGPLINLCLDIMLREHSDGRYGVQNLVEDLLKKYGPERSFNDDELFNEIVQLCKYPELMNFFSMYVKGNQALPLKEEFAKVGLEFSDGKIKALESLTEKQKKLRYDWINQ